MTDDASHPESPEVGAATDGPNVPPTAAGHEPPVVYGPAAIDAAEKEPAVGDPPVVNDPSAGDPAAVAPPAVDPISEPAPTAVERGGQEPVPSTEAAPEDPLHREYLERDTKLRTEALRWNGLSEGIRLEWEGLVAENRTRLESEPSMEIVVRLLDRSVSDNFALPAPAALTATLPAARVEEPDEEADAKARAERWEALDGLSAAQRDQERAVTRFLKGQVVPVVEAAHRQLRNPDVPDGPREALAALADACDRPALRLERRAPAPNDPFDPETQESMGSEYDATVPRDHVLQGFGGGYLFCGPDDRPRVLQYAPVEVSLGPKEGKDDGQ